MQILPLAILCCSTGSSSGQYQLSPLREVDSFSQRLLEPHSGVIDGTEFREAILMVAQPRSQRSGSINVWIDRKVNPNALISPGALGPTRFASLAQIADQVDCVCFPVDACVLVGREKWVQKNLMLLSESASSAPLEMSSTNDSRTIDVSWPILSTPTEARRAVVSTAADADRRWMSQLERSPLPHDLWAANRWIGISPRVGIRLIEGQFETHASPSPGTEVAVPTEGRFARSYRFAEIEGVLKSTGKEPSTRISRRGKMVHVDATAETHIELCHRLLSDRTPSVATSSSSGKDILQKLKDDKRTFTLTVKNQPARDVLRALASQLNLRCEFAGANPAYDHRVSFEAVDQTLWQLVGLITEQASLKIDAPNDMLRFSAATSR